MNKLRYPVLAAALYTKRLGFAVADNEDILYFGVKTFCLPRTLESVKTETSRFIVKIINEFQIKSAVFKKLDIRQLKSEKEKAVLKRLKIVCRLRKIPVIEISLKEVKELLFKEQNSAEITKKLLYRELTSLYPEFKRLAEFQNQDQAEYYNSVLSAVAVAHFVKECGNRH